jgi:hypothetical protein
MDNVTSTDAISALWDRSTGSPDEEWTYWQTFAAVCLSDTTVAVILEESSIPQLTNHDEVRLGVIERLLLELTCSYVLNPWVEMDSDADIEGHRNSTAHSAYDTSAGFLICLDSG